MRRVRLARFLAQIRCARLPYPLQVNRVNQYYRRLSLLGAICHQVTPRRLPDTETALEIRCAAHSQCQFAQPSLRPRQYIHPTDVRMKLDIFRAASSTVKNPAPAFEHRAVR